MNRSLIVVLVALFTQGAWAETHSIKAFLADPVAVLDEQGALVGELSEQDLMVRESGFQPGPYVMLLDAVIYLRNPLNWDKEVHQVLGSTVGDVMGQHPHTCSGDLPLPAAARLLHEGKTQRLFVVDAERRPVGVLTRGDVVRALAAAG